MAVFFSDTTSGDGTLQAIEDIRAISEKQCFVSGMSAVVEDIKNLSGKESVMYVIIAVILVSVILAVTMDSFLIPIFFMLSIGMAIVYNLGTNFVKGEISFITQALAAVLQLGVTMDYSIFLYHSYKEKQEIYPGDKECAMTHAISNTKSVSLPIILVCVIEFAIFINMGIPCFTGTVLPFIASIVIGTIQLGATVDYAILMSTRYKKERYNGRDKKQAVEIALQTSIKSIIISALGFFAATFGVGAYSSIDMISSLCTLMSRGAIISMITVITVLPSLLMLFDKLICATTMGIKPRLFKIPEKNYSKPVTAEIK